ncbi:MAG: acyl-ACP--UDP-N-acetylglucosamine O-acyltransferase [Deltaproteobacteria bacterium]|nr:acyl-ACP--UDP-N-acetylglucosamine O-acyltransferase [Deltaproteobacteria bacterium]
MIDKTAIIYEGARIDDSTDIGPYTVIKDGVKIGKNNKIASHVVVEGNTTIGDNNKIFQFASIGSIPQDLKYKGEDTKLVIGNNNIIREYATFNTGTITGRGTTIIGDFNLFMMHVHVAHDCTVGSHTILANNATLAGHIEIDDYAILGGICAVHQFVRIGESALIAGGSMVVQDIPPYLVASGDRAKIYGVNRIGLERRGFSKEEIGKIKSAFKIIYRSKVTTKIAIERIKRELSGSETIEKFTGFIERSKRGIAR